MIPITTNIAGHDFKIELKDSGGLQNQISGHIKYNENLIVIQSDISESRKEEVFAHEIIHGLLEKSGTDAYLTKFGADTEIVCCSLENIFWKFLKDNTNIFEEK